MVDYANQVRQQRDRITRMLDRGPTVGEVGDAMLSAVGSGRDYGTQLREAREAAVSTQLGKLDLLQQGYADQVAATAAQRKQMVEDREFGLEREKLAQDAAQFQATQNRLAGEFERTESRLDRKEKAQAAQWETENELARNVHQLNKETLDQKKREDDRRFEHDVELDWARKSQGDRELYLKQAEQSFNKTVQQWKEAQAQKKNALEQGRFDLEKEAQATEKRLALSLIQHRIDELTIRREEAKNERERFQFDKQVQITKWLKEAAEKQQADAEHVLSVFSELTENATAESVGAFAEAIFDADEPITAKNAMKVMGPLAKQHLKDKPAEQAYEKKHSSMMGEYAAGKEIALREQAGAAGERLAMVGELKDILGQEETTAYTPLLVGLQRWAEPIGVDLEGIARRVGLGGLNDVSNIQRFNQIIGQLVLESAEQMKGPLAVKELQFLREMQLNAGTSWEANVRGLVAMETIAKHIEKKEQSYRTFREDYLAKGGDPADLWFKFEEHWNKTGPTLRMPRMARPRQAAPQGGEAQPIAGEMSERNYTTYQTMPPGPARQQWLDTLSDAELEAIILREQEDAAATRTQ